MIHWFQEDKYIVCKRCRVKLAHYNGLFAMSKEGVQTSYCNPGARQLTTSWRNPPKTLLHSYSWIHSWNAHRQRNAAGSCFGERPTVKWIHLVSRIRLAIAVLFTLHEPFGLEILCWKIESCAKTILWFVWQKHKRWRIVWNSRPRRVLRMNN